MSQWTPLPQPPSYQSIRELENHRSQTQLDLNHYRQVSSQSRDSNELEAAKRKIQELEQRMANVNQQMQEMRATIHTQSEAMQQPSRSRQGGSQAPIAPYTGPDLITLTPPEVVPPPRVDPPPRVGSPPQAAPPPRVAPPPRFDPGGFISKLAREAAARVRRQTPAPAKTETQARTSEQTMNRASQNGQPRPTAYFPQRFMGHNNQTHRPAHYQEQASINMSHTNQNDQNQQLTYNQEQAANNMNYAGQNNHDRRPTYGQEQSASNLNYATQTNHHRRPTHGQEQGEINMNYVNQNSHNRRPTKNQNHGTSNMDYAVYNQENVQNPLPVPDRDGILRMPDGELIRDLNVTGDASWNKINGKTRSNTSSTINAQSDRYNPSVPDLILPANAAQQGGFRALQMVRDIQGKGPPPSPLHSPKHPSISDANEDFTFCTLFGKFFEMSQQYALTHANFTSTAADAALSPNIKTMLIEICPTEVGSLMSSGQTRCYMVARIINQWVVQHIWNRDVFAGFSQQIDARVKEIGGQIFENTPHQVRAMYLKQIAHEKMVMKDMPGFESFFGHLCKKRGHDLWLLVKPLMYQNTGRDAADMQTLMWEAHNTAGRMFSGANEFKFTFPQVTDRFDGATMISKDPLTHFNSEQLQLRSATVKMSATPIVGFRTYKNGKQTNTIVYLSQVLIKLRKAL